VTAQPEIPLAPKINATFFGSVIAIVWPSRYFKETSGCVGDEVLIRVL
jgi:hypothetical protein